MHFKRGTPFAGLMRILSATLLVAAVLAPTAGFSAGERIAVLVSSSEPPFDETLAGFRTYLEKQGLPVDLEIHRLSRDPAQAEAAVARIGKSGARLIFALGSLGTDAAVRGIRDIPIVSCLVLRPDRFAATPNATGVSLEFPLKVQFERLKTVLPQAKTIGVMYNPDENGARIEEAARVAESMGLDLDAIEVNSPRDVPSALTALSKRVDAIWGLADTTTLSPQLAKYILLFAFRNSIPFIGPSDSWAKAGALYSLDWDYQDMGAQCADMAAHILRGTPVPSIPPASPRKFHYSLNLKTSQQIKVPIPEEIVKKARRIY